MNNTTAGVSSKPRGGTSQPSETSFKRKRGVFQKECKFVEVFLMNDGEGCHKITSNYLCVCFRVCLQCSI